MNPTTEYIRPPIPFRGMDWVAYHDPEGIYGYGETEAKAIEDLNEQMESSS